MVVLHERCHGMFGFFSKMITRIRELRARARSSKDGRTLISNFKYMMLLQVMGYFFPLITIPYLARVIGVDGFGKIAFAAAIIVWFQTITDWGFNYTATRDVAQNKDDLDKVSEIFSNVFWAKVVLMVLSLALLLMAIVLIPYFKENHAIILVTFLLVPAHIMFPDWFFQAMERMRFITIFNLISRALFTVLVFVFINDKEDFILQPVLVSAGMMLCGFFSMYLIVVKWKVKLISPSWFCILRTLKKSSNVFVNNMVPNLYNSFSVVLLGFYGGSASNGLLDSGRKFAEIGSQFLKVVSRVFFPFLSRKIHKHDLYMVVQLGLSFLFSSFLFVAAPWIIQFFFTPEFFPAITILQIMSLSLIFLSLSNIYGTNYMIIKGHERSLRNITVLTSLTGFVFAFPLIYYYDYVGAALTITLTRALLGGAVTAKARKLKKREQVL